MTTYQTCRAKEGEEKRGGLEVSLVVPQRRDSIGPVSSYMKSPVDLISQLRHGERLQSDASLAKPHADRGILASQFRGTEDQRFRYWNSRSDISVSACISFFETGPHSYLSAESASHARWWSTGACHDRHYEYIKKVVNKTNGCDRDWMTCHSWASVSRIIRRFYFHALVDVNGVNRQWAAVEVVLTLASCI
jgi:hypothetical protein